MWMQEPPRNALHTRLLLSPCSNRHRMVHSWLAKCLRRFPNGKRPRTRLFQHRDTFRPLLESLEERVVPANLQLVSHVDPSLISDTASGASTQASVSQDG